MMEDIITFISIHITLNVFFVMEGLPFNFKDINDHDSPIQSVYQAYGTTEIQYII